MNECRSGRLTSFGMAVGLVLALVVCLPGTASADAIPAGYTCSGNCGSSGADGVVPLSPAGNSQYQWVSTNLGLSGVGKLPTGALGSETNGSTLSTPTFSATAGAPLDFFFNYVTSDGAGFADYAWAALFKSSNSLAALLFTARTSPSGSIVPGFGMPAPAATLTPSSVPIIAGGPTWSPLGIFSGSCFSAGCGHTGWVKSSFTIGTDGDYFVKVGVTNWLDTSFDSGLALDGVTVSGQPIGKVPEPATLGLVGMGLAGLGLMSRRKKVA